MLDSRSVRAAGEACDSQSSHAIDADRSGPSAEHVNKCMLVLLFICLVLVGSILGAAGHLRSERPSVAETRSPVPLSVND